MIARIRNRVTYANVVASLALFIALGGAAVAAGLPRNSVGPNQIKQGAVGSKKLHKEAVTFSKLANGAVSGAKITNAGIVARKLANGAVSSAALANGAVTASKLGKSSVVNASIDNGVVGTNKLGNGVVTGVKLADKSVTADKLAPGVLLSQEGNLASGQTLRGVFQLGGEAKTAYSGQTFQFPLANAPAFQNNVLAKGKTSSACPGSGGGSNPQAAAGQLCVYIGESANLEDLDFADGGVNRLGFGLFAGYSSAGSDNYARGVWAVTAP